MGWDGFDDHDEGYWDHRIYCCCIWRRIAWRDSGAYNWDLCNKSMSLLKDVI